MGPGRSFYLYVRYGYMNATVRSRSSAIAYWCTHCADILQYSSGLESANPTRKYLVLFVLCVCLVSPHGPLQVKQIFKDKASAPRAILRPRSRVPIPNPGPCSSPLLCISPSAGAAGAWPGAAGHYDARVRDHAGPTIMQAPLRPAQHASLLGWIPPPEPSLCAGARSPEYRALA